MGSMGFRMGKENWFGQELIKGLITLVVIILAFYFTSLVFHDRITHLDKTIGGGVYQNIHIAPRIGKLYKVIPNFEDILIEVNSSEYLAKYVIANYGDIPLSVKGASLFKAIYLEEGGYQNTSNEEDIELLDKEGSELLPIGILSGGEKSHISVRYKPMSTRGNIEYRWLCIHFESTDPYYEDTELRDCAIIFIKWL